MDYLKSLAAYSLVMGMLRKKVSSKLLMPLAILIKS